MANKRSGDRVITEQDYRELTYAFKKLTEASSDLECGVKLMQNAMAKCCLHKGGDGLKKVSEMGKRVG